MRPSRSMSPASSHRGQVSTDLLGVAARCKETGSPDMTATGRGCTGRTRGSIRSDLRHLKTSRTQEWPLPRSDAGQGPFSSAPFRWQPERSPMTDAVGTRVGAHWRYASHPRFLSTSHPEHGRADPTGSVRRRQRVAGAQRGGHPAPRCRPVDPLRRRSRGGAADVDVG
jgi:hypothetical protein